MAVAWRDVVFQYDGTFDGFLCCVFESYVHKEFPIAFSGDEECWSLYEVRYVVTERAHAQRVYQSILRRSKAAAGTSSFRDTSARPGRTGSTCAPATRRKPSRRSTFSCNSCGRTVSTSA